MSIFRAFAFWAAATAVSCSLTPRQAWAQPSFESQVDSLFSEFDRATPGCAVGVYRAGDILFSRGYGLADVAENLPITARTVFNVASLSKQFTAFAVALLASEGRLSLDAEVQAYVPELPNFADPITVRHLIHHTSGLRDYGALKELSGWRLDDRLSKSELLALLQRQRGLNFDPGERHEYNNTNYVLLALIVERVSGQRFRDFAAERIFRPLGMTSTEVRDDPDGPIPRRAVNYTLQSDGTYASNRVWDRAYATGVSNVHTNIYDLARWDGNFFHPIVGKEDLLRTLYTPGTLASGESTSYAYGLGLARHRGMLTVSHSGIGGGSFYFLRFPEQRLSVAILCNRYGVGAGAPDTWNLSHAVADIFLTGMSVVQPVNYRQSPGPPLRVPVGELARYAGTYWKADGAPINIELRDEQLVEVYDDRPYVLVPTGDGTFRDAEGNATYTFAGPGRQTLTYRELPTGFTATGERRPHWTPTRSELTRAVGRYCTSEVPVCWSLLLEDGIFVLRRPGFADRALNPAFVDTFSLVDTDAIGKRSMRIGLQRASDGSIVGLSVSRGRVSRLLFQRE